VLLSLAFATVLYAANQNAPTHPLTPQPLNACSLVTRFEVEQAIGRRVAEGKEESERRASNCDYSAKGALVSITIQRLTTKPALDTEIPALKKEIPEGVVREARDFPHAFFLDVPDAGTQLHILNESNEYLMISILGFGDPSQVSATVLELARKAMRRL
jgi:hypothetical protein